VKLALVTTPPSVRSGIGDYTRHLVPYLREHCDVDFVVESGEDEEAWDGARVIRAEDLVAKDYDQILYQLGNERSHAFMARMVRAIGGTVMQHDWVLFDMAVAAYPALQRGGCKGTALAWREGGAEQVAVYTKNWMDRRRQRSTPQPALDVTGLPGPLLFGWHEAEEDGRWTTDLAAFRLPAGARSATIRLVLEGGRTARVLRGGSELGSCDQGECRVALEPGSDEPLSIRVSGVRVTPEQRRHGDSRRLGAFVRSIHWRDDEGEHELDLGAAPEIPVTPIHLARDRFELPMNRSIVRFADAFIVHSDYVRSRILADRNAHTPVGVLHHGAERRWRDEDRREIRRRLGLEESWSDAFLVTSFGGVQAHKRIDRALEALALARRERDQIRFALAGSVDRASFDPRAMAKRLGIADAVRFTGWVKEHEGWDWLHAGDIALNLRGPTSGGTSGGIFQAFSMGRPVIATGAAEQAELPDSCVVKVPIGEGEVEALASELVALCDDVDRRRALERAARAFVEDECHWSIMARRYAEYLEAFPRPRAGRRSLFALARAKGRAEGALAASR